MKRDFFGRIQPNFWLRSLVACSSQSTGEKNWEKIEKRGSIKVARLLELLYPQSYHDDKNNLTGYDVEILKENVLS